MSTEAHGVIPSISKAQHFAHNQHVEALLKAKLDVITILLSLPVELPTCVTP